MNLPAWMSAWVLSLLVSIAPPEKLAALPQFPGWEESAVASRARLSSVADDITEAVLSGEPLGFQGKHAAEEMARLLVALAGAESRFAPDVDGFACYRGPGQASRCGGGRYVTIWQLDPKVVAQVEHIDPATLKDRKVAARIAIRFARRSRATCRRLGPNAALDIWVGGHCDELGNTQIRNYGLVRLAAAARLPGMPAWPGAPAPAPAPPVETVMPPVIDDLPHFLINNPLSPEAFR